MDRHASIVDGFPVTGSAKGYRISYRRRFTGSRWMMRTLAPCGDADGGSCDRAQLQFKSLAIVLMRVHCNIKFAPPRTILISSGSIDTGGMPCRPTNTVARSAAKRSRASSISPNMHRLIRLALIAEATRFNTYRRHLSRRRQERADPGGRRYFSVLQALTPKSLTRQRVWFNEDFEGIASAMPAWLAENLDCQ